MIPRILIASVLCALLAGGVWLLYLPASPAAAMAGNLQGERWYNLMLADRHLGYWHTRNSRDDDGNWVFASEQRFAMTPYDPVATTVRRTFAADPPHRLLTAVHLEIRRQHQNGVRIEPAGEHYRAIRLPEESATGQSLDWQYTLADYLDFELWLDTETPGSGGSRTVPTLDFERTELVRRSFDVVDRNGDGYVIENAAPLSATRIQLDHDYAPVAVEIAGLFSLRRSSREAALAPRSTLQSASYYIPVNRRLADHTRISRLVLAVAGYQRPADLFSPVEQADGQWRLTLTANPISSSAMDDSLLAETLTIPARHPEIRMLTDRVVGDLEDELARARALNRFVHEYLSYRPGTPPRSVLALLEDRRGDCTEFADLLTTLARNAGLPSRTVFGLAYADAEAPAFEYHAWNELFVDGDWVAMDPTWGQDRVDATHIPLPADETAALKLLTGAVELTFTVVDVEHFRN